MILHRKILLGLLSVTLLTSPFALAREPQPLTALPIEQMRATVYTKEFAKRFALPDPEPGSEPSGGVQAMEFAVEPGPWWLGEMASCHCKLYLYLDNKLPIAYPEEAVRGTVSIPSQKTQLMTIERPRWLNLSEKDRLHFSERNKSMLATSDFVWNKAGGGAGMFYDEYHRDLFPGLAYLKIDMGCPNYSWMDKVETMQIWIQREGTKDYRHQLREEPEDFLKFTLPKVFSGRIFLWIKQTAEYNGILIDKINRERTRNRQKTEVQKNIP
jgi:hypothetical protein